MNFKFFLENFDPLPMVYRPPYPWNIDPPTYGILTPLPMEYRTPYPWYFDLPGRKAKRMVLQCNNGVGSNPVEGRTKI